MPIYPMLGLQTPPGSPDAKVSGLYSGSQVHKATEIDSSSARSRCLRSLSLGLLTPPTTPRRGVPIARRAFTHVSTTQVDGNVDPGSDTCSTASSDAGTGLTNHLSASPTSTPPSRQCRLIDLTSPSDSAFHSPRNDGLDTPTPLTRALPAETAFPFPSQGRSRNTLSPLSLRRSRPHSLPGHGTSTQSIFRSRRFSASDRFIAERSPSVSINENFRLSRCPERLTHHERATRRRLPGADPFAQRVQRQTAATHVNNTSRPAAPPATGANNVPVHPGRGFRADGARQVNSGSVWNVGAGTNAGDGAGAVHDGRGGVLGSGTNAPLFTAPFLTRNDTSGELDLFERRLALAFDIDQSSRVVGGIEGSQSSNTPSRAQLRTCYSPSSPNAQSPEGDTVWKDSEWIQDSTLSSTRSLKACAELS